MHCIGGLVGPRASLNNFGEEKNLLPPLGFKTQTEHNNNTVFIVVMRSAYTISECISQWACNVLFKKIQSYWLCTYTVGSEVHFPYSLFTIYYFYKGLNKSCIC
jgi:hypothetical protein